MPGRPMLSKHHAASARRPEKGGDRELNVIERLAKRIQQAHQSGFRIRSEYLDGGQASWCEIAGKKTIFVDQSQTAAEQLHQLNETLSQYADYLQSSSISPQKPT